MAEGKLPDGYTVKKRRLVKDPDAKVAKTGKKKGGKTKLPKAA